MIYCLKIYLFRHQVQLDHTEETVIKDIYCFVITCYAKYWFTCMNSIEAPLNDILFWKKLVSYKKYEYKNCRCSNKKKKCCNNLWYLNEECIMFLVFDERFSVEDKRKIVKIIFQENYNDELDVVKRIIIKLEDITKFIQRDIPIELFTPNLLKLFS